MKGAFEKALGPNFDNLAPEVREHIATRPGSRLYTGTMTSVWRRPGWRGWLAWPFLHLAARSETLFPETGREVPFTLENICQQDTAGQWTMTWSREFQFPNHSRRFTASMHYDSDRGILVDLLGKQGTHEVELHPREENGVFRMVSGRQWLRTPFGRIPIPRLLTGQADVTEKELPDRKLAIQVTIRNPALGAFFGYEGVFGKSDNQWAYS